MRAPSGEQFEIAFEDQRVVAVEVGGGLRTYSVDGWSVLDGYDADEMATAGRGQVLTPWPNRLQDGSYEFDGTALPASAERARALERDPRSRPLGRLAAQRSTSRTVSCSEHVVHPQPGYPFTLEIGIEYELAETGLTVRTTATNVGAAPAARRARRAPVPHGWTRKRSTTCVLRLPARTVLDSDERGLPTGTTPVEGTELDFRAGRRIGDARLDHGFTDLERDDSGIASVELTAVEGGRSATLWVDESYPYLMVFTGDLAEVSRRGLAVEPMTCAPNAFRTGDGLIVIEPGESATAAWGITPQ